jgi:hypothetical protein
MANNQYINKVIFGGSTLIDLTGDTVDAAHLLSGSTAHDKSGATITGTCTYDSDTSDDTAAASEILAGKTAHARGAELTGTMPNNGAVTGTISTKSQQYTIAAGYHDGSGKVSIASAEQNKIIAGNIKSGVEILGVTGTYSGESISATAVNITPSTSAQTILPPTGYDYISQANVAAISYVETDNSAGGKTATIAG